MPRASKPSFAMAIVLSLAIIGCSSSTITVKEASTEQCPYGGQIFSVDSVDYAVCHGAPGAAGTEGTSGEKGDQGQGATVTAEEPGTNCTYGGLKVQVGSAATYVCNGAPGVKGDQGDQGEAGTSVVVTTVEAGDETCPDGGIIVQVGADTSTQKYICNAAPGEKGDTGEQGEAGTSVVVTTVETGNETCQYGGIIVQVGTDTSTQKYLCNGAPGEAGHSPVITVADVADGICADGGFVVTVDNVTNTVCKGGRFHAAGLELGALAYDDTWTVGGAPLSWRVVHKDGVAGTVTLFATRKVGDQPFRSADWDNRYGNSTARTWLNGTFYATFSAAFASIVTTTSVPWVIENPAAEPSSGVTQDHVFLASRTELGGTSLANEGTVFDWFADSSTAAARRAVGAVYWTRTGNRTEWDGSPVDLTGYYVLENGDLGTGAWVPDTFAMVPALNVDDSAVFVRQADGSYRLLTP